MVAKCTKPEIKTSFGLKCKSPKAKEKKAAKRENGAWMWDFGEEASSKTGLVGDRWDIAAEHEFHAQNAKSAGSYITGALSRENLCLSHIGGGGGTRTPVRKRTVKSVYERSLHFLFSGYRLLQARSSSPSPCYMSSTVHGPNMSSKPVLVTPGTAPTGRERADG